MVLTIRNINFDQRKKRRFNLKSQMQVQSTQKMVEECIARTCQSAIRGAEALSRPRPPTDGLADAAQPPGSPLRAAPQRSEAGTRLVDALRPADASGRRIQMFVGATSPRGEDPPWCQQNAGEQDATSQVTLAKGCASCIQSGGSFQKKSPAPT